MRFRRGSGSGWGVKPSHSTITDVAAIGGEEWPFSQFATVQPLTPRRGPSCRWVSPHSRRFRRICSPRDLGSKSKVFRFRHLSETRRNGKKATPPCPCGWLGHFSARCRCTPDQVLRYRSRISGPLLDRIDLHVEVPALREAELHDSPRGESSEAVRARVQEARTRQLARQGGCNARLEGAGIERQCAPDADARALLREAASRQLLSARGFHRALKVARTIADLARSGPLRSLHVAEALAYRNADRGENR